MLVVLAAILMQGAALTASEPSPLTERLITTPNWLRRPTADDITRVYPLSAQREVLDGNITLNCEVDASGQFEDCRVIPDFGIESERFAEAALKLSKLFRMASIDGQGQPVSGARLHLPISFWLPGGVELSPVHGRWVGPKAQGIVDCRAKPDGNVDNCVPVRLTPFSIQVRAAALELASQVHVSKGLTSPTRVRIPIELESSN